MRDESKLSDYNVKPGNTIYMVLQLRGGMNMDDASPRIRLEKMSVMGNSAQSVPEIQHCRGGSVEA